MSCHSIGTVLACLQVLCHVIGMVLACIIYGMACIMQTSCHSKRHGSCLLAIVVPFDLARILHRHNVDVQ